MKFDPSAFVQALQQQDRICDIKVCGICLGDRFDDLIKVDLTEQEVKMGAWFRIYSGIRFYGAIVEEVKRITGIFLPAKSFEVLPTPILDTIELHHGEAYFVEQRNGSTYFHYPAHQTILSPQSGKDGPCMLYIGEGGPKLPLYTAYSFLEVFVDFIISLNNAWEVKVKPDPGSLPYYYQQRLLAFLRAFDLGEEINADLLQYKFLLNRSPEDGIVIDGFIVELIEGMEDKEMAQRLKLLRVRTPRTKSHHTIQQIFGSLLSIYIRYKRFLPTSYFGYEGPSYTVEFASYYTREVYSSIKQEAVEKIRSILAFIIDPQQRTFDKKQMIEQFGYPDVDLEQMAREEEVY